MSAPSPTPPPSAALLAAAQVSWARQGGRELPEGRFDAAKRFWPAAAERRACCAAISSPYKNRSSLLAHCRTLGHVAALHGVEVAALTALRAELGGAARLGKALAVVASQAPAGLSLALGLAASWEGDGAGLIDVVSGVEGVERPARSPRRPARPIRAR